MSNRQRHTPSWNSPSASWKARAPAAWDRIRRDLSGAAERSGLIDVAFERHDTPLGTIVVGATREGLVRVGLPSQDEDEVLQELAERVSPRVLHASRGVADADQARARRVLRSPPPGRSRSRSTGASRAASGGRCCARRPRSRTGTRPPTATWRRAPAAPARREPQARRWRPTRCRSSCRAIACCAPAAASAATAAASRPRPSCSASKACWPASAR